MQQWFEAGSITALAIDLADYERGEAFAGDYDTALAQVQKRLSRLQVAHMVCNIRSMIVFEGWDAAGKGGAIQRLTMGWDPRHFHVWPISAPTEEERSRHFLWRFWQKIPGKGHIAIFDRSWYGRVLVERVEHYAAERQWRRAYDEINEFEAQQQTEVRALRQPLHPGPFRRPFGAPEDRRQPRRQRRRFADEPLRHQSEAAERRPAHELRSGDEHDRAAR